MAAGHAQPESDRCVRRSIAKVHLVQLIAIPAETPMTLMMRPG
jgi:hypothetical protein